MPTIKDLERELEQVEQQSSELQLENNIRQTLLSYKGEDEVISFADYRKIELENPPKKPFISGLKELDDLLDFGEEELITITAPTGMGKTTYCAYLTKKFAEQGLKSLWFCYENSNASLLEKFGDKIPEGYLPKTLTDRSIIWIERRIVEGLAKFNTKVVFIDHLHYLIDMNGTRNMSLVIGDIMRQLKILSKKYKITIFIVAHTTKIAEDSIVGLDSIRDSSFIGQESDAVIALWRVRQRQKRIEMQENGIIYTNETMIAVVKNRKTGRLGSFKMVYANGQYNKPSYNSTYNYDEADYTKNKEDLFGR